jgi:hypothetical protein
MILLSPNPENNTDNLLQARFQVRKTLAAAKAV